MPLRIFRNRDRSGANLIMLCVGTAMFGMFFFLTLFQQTVWGWSALKTGVAYLPMVAVIMLMSGVSAQLVSRIGARPILLAGSAVGAGGMFWLSRITEHSTYVGGLLGPEAAHRGRPGHAVHAADPGRPGQGQGPGRGPGREPAQRRPAGRRGDRARPARHRGLDRGRQQRQEPGRAAAAAAAKAGHAVHAKAGGSVPTAIYHHALAVGFSRGSWSRPGSACWA